MKAENGDNVKKIEWQTDYERYDNDKVFFLNWLTITIPITRDEIYKFYKIHGIQKIN